MIPLSAKRCKKIITISESSKNDINKYLKINNDKIAVTPLALNEELLKVWRGEA